VKRRACPEWSVFVIAVAGALAAFVLLAIAHPSTALATLICLVTLIPLFIRREPLDLFSPWNYMLYFVILNVLIRTTLIDFGLTGGRVDLNSVFFLDQPGAFLVKALGLMLFGFLFLVIGYMLPKSVPVTLNLRIFRADAVDPRKFDRMMKWMLAISSMALIAFVAVTFKGAAEFTLALISSHRGLSNNLDEYRAHGYLRLLIGMSSLVVYLTYVRLRTTTDSRRLYRALFVAGVVVSVAMAFYSQSRAALIFVFLNLLFIRYYLSRGRFPWKAFVTLSPLLIAVFVFTTSLRTGSGLRLGDHISPMIIVAPIVLNNGGIDASKTGHVVDYIDATQDYRYGETLIEFVWAVVPRILWTGKPANLDTFIGQRIYGAVTYGAAAVPPGFFAEMYMNYWYVGIIVGGVILGVLMKKIRNLLEGNKTNQNFVVFYVVVLQPFGMSVLGSGVSSSIMGALMAGVPLCIAFYLTLPRPDDKRSKALQHTTAGAVP